MASSYISSPGSYGRSSEVLLKTYSTQIMQILCCENADRIAQHTATLNELLSEVDTWTDVALPPGIALPLGLPLNHDKTIAPPGSLSLSQKQQAESDREIRETAYGPKPVVPNWTGLNPEWQDFCPANVRGHNCPGEKYCGSVRVCTFKKRAKWPRQWVEHKMHCQVPDALHILSTCNNLANGVSCPEYENRGRDANGIWRSCHYGHDYPAERRLLQDSLKSHEEYYCGVKAVEKEKEKLKPAERLDTA